VRSVKKNDPYGRRELEGEGKGKEKVDTTGQSHRCDGKYEFYHEYDGNWLELFSNHLEYY
jgi:hypothetical protein